MILFVIASLSIAACIGMVAAGQYNTAAVFYVPFIVALVLRLCR